MGKVSDFFKLKNQLQKIRMHYKNKNFLSNRNLENIINLIWILFCIIFDIFLFKFEKKYWKNYF